jgi:DNA-binding MarR family transcriptional regulator
VIVATTSTMRANPGGQIDPADAASFDLETRANRNDHLALRLWLRMLSCNMRIQNQIRVRLRREFNTTLPRFDVMAQLDRHPQGLRMNELSKRLMVSGGNITGIADQLEKEHLAARVLDPSDRRALTLKLTAAGIKRFREMAAHNERWTIELMQGLERGEKQVMLQLLGKLKCHLDGGREPSTHSASRRRR